jgi:O-antigen/teichoic acid export membrane protein
MVGLIALGATRVVHMSLISHATDQATVAVVGTLVGLAMTAGLFLPGGLATAAARFIPYHRGAGEDSTARRAYRWLTITGYGCAIGLGAIIAVIAATMPRVTTGDAIAVGVLTAVYAAYSVAKAALFGFDRVVPYTWLEVAGSAVAIGATVVVLATGRSDYLAPLTLGYAVLMIGALVVLRRERATGTSAGALRLDGREIATYVGLASLGGLASGGLLQVLPALAGRFTSLTEVSYFAAAVALVAPLYFLPRALGMALFPSMAKAHGAGDVDAVKRHADIFTRALLVVLAPLFAAGLLVAPEALALFGGREYVDGAGVLRLILLATYVAVVQVAAVNSLSSGDGVRVPVWWSVVGAVLGLGALIPLGSALGGTGVALAYLIAITIGAAGPIAVAWRRFEMAWTGPAVRSFAVVAAALLVGQAVDSMSGAFGAGRIAIDVIAAVALAIAGGLVLRAEIRRVLAARSTL